MVVEFLPAVAHAAIEAILAAQVVVEDVVLLLPVEAADGLVVVDRGVASVVLEVVRVYAESLVVLGQIEGAEHRLVVEHVKVFIVLVVVDELDADLIFAVRKGAVVPILAAADTAREVGTELLLVGLELVELLYA